MRAISNICAYRGVGWAPQLHNVDKLHNVDISVDPNKVGSAGTPGWDDKMCQTVAQQSNDWGAQSDQRAANGDLSGAVVAA